MTVIVEPVNMAVSIEEARVSARANGPELDAEIEVWVRAFTKDAEHDTGRAIIDQTHRVAIDAFPVSDDGYGKGAIVFPVSPVKSVEIKFLDTDGAWQTLHPDDYILYNESAPCYVLPAPGRAWPATFARAEAVRADAVCGYGPSYATTPASFKTYILGNMQAHYMGASAPNLGRLLWPYKVFA